jgi:hypothetical protein
MFRYPNIYNKRFLNSSWKHLAVITLRIFLIFNILLLQISCGGSSLHKTVCLKRANLKGISKVAIVASSNPPEVSYADVKSPAWAPLLLIFTPLVIGLVQAAMESSMDSDHAKQIGSGTDPLIINDTMANAFLSALGKDHGLSTIEYVKGQDEQKLLDAGYHSLIQLTVGKIYFIRAAENRIRLYVNVKGTMKSLESENIIWDREESVTPLDAYSLEYYKENATKELRLLLEKAGRNLAYDFRYLE